MHSRIFSLTIVICILVFFSNLYAKEPNFPVEAEVFVAPFDQCEGIAFNGEGRLFVTGNQALHEIETDGATHKIVDLYSNLGLAGIGERDLMVADFGLTNAFRHDRNNDGVVWRITPAGVKKEFATGIGDPNFIVVRKDGTLLVTDDATNEIFTIDSKGTVKLFCTAVNHPNGLALSADESVMYVAQIFKSIRPIVSDDRVWAVSLNDDKPAGAAEVIAHSGDGASNDGLAMDIQGRLYICANMIGKILRYDPKTLELITITENVFGAASIAFGEGHFDHESIYVTTTYSQGRGGKVFRIPVGVKGAKLNR
ncbi:MAG: SMP-30/gluconolactonase/LRE family protein [Verrucomicrobia bacterium]|nr:SMP-30/gluconolactonase/LRE family protein [Verrucomicrobiota bacterium]